MADTEPTMIDCEGVGGDTHGVYMMPTTLQLLGMCRMCGNHVEVEGLPYKAVYHQRRDVLADLYRGDFS